MQIHIHIHDHRDKNSSDFFEKFGRRLLDTLEQSNRNQSLIIQKLNKMGPELEALKTEVQETKTIMQSAKTLIVGLKEKLDAAIASGDPAALTALSQELDTSANELAAAVAANTPQEGQPGTGDGTETGEGPTPEGQA